MTLAKRDVVSVFEELAKDVALGEGTWYDVIVNADLTNDADLVIYILGNATTISDKYLHIHGPWAAGDLDTGLVYVTLDENIDLIKFLIGRGANRIDECMCMAAMEGNKQIVNVFSGYCSWTAWSVCINEVASVGDERMVHYCIEQCVAMGGFIDWRTAADKAAQSGYTTIANYLNEAQDTEYRISNEAFEKLFVNYIEHELYVHIARKMQKCHVILHLTNKEYVMQLLANGMKKYGILDIFRRLCERVFISYSQLYKINEMHILERILARIHVTQINDLADMNGCMQDICGYTGYHYIYEDTTIDNRPWSIILLEFIESGYLMILDMLYAYFYSNCLTLHECVESPPPYFAEHIYEYHKLITNDTNGAEKYINIAISHIKLPVDYTCVCNETSPEICAGVKDDHECSCIMDVRACRRFSQHKCVCDQGSVMCRGRIHSRHYHEQTSLLDCCRMCSEYQYTPLELRQLCAISVVRFMFT